MPTPLPGAASACWCEEAIWSLGSGCETCPPEQVAHVSSTNTQNGVVLPLGPKASVSNSSHLILPSKDASSELYLFSTKQHQ